MRYLSFCVSLHISVLIPTEATATGKNKSCVNGGRSMRPPVHGMSGKVAEAANSLEHDV
jgi:hypothetical protein